MLNVDTLCVTVCIDATVTTKCHWRYGKPTRILSFSQMTLFKTDHIHVCCVYVHSARIIYFMNCACILNLKNICIKFSLLCVCLCVFVLFCPDLTDGITIRFRVRKSQSTHLINWHHLTKWPIFPSVLLISICTYRAHILHTIRIDQCQHVNRCSQRRNMSLCHFSLIIRNYDR